MRSRQPPSPRKAWNAQGGQSHGDTTRDARECQLWDRTLEFVACVFECALQNFVCSEPARFNCRRFAVSWHSRLHLPGDLFVVRDVCGKWK
jgi:hypothetical protein